MKKMKSLIGLFASCFAIVLALAVWAGINPPFRYLQVRTTVGQAALMITKSKSTKRK